MSGARERAFCRRVLSAVCCGLGQLLIGKVRTRERKLLCSAVQQRRTSKVRHVCARKHAAAAAGGLTSPLRQSLRLNLVDYAAT